MGWNSLRSLRARRVAVKALLAAALALVGSRSLAQDATLTNGILSVTLGGSATNSGSLSIATTPTNPYAPNQPILVEGILPTTTAGFIRGTHIYLRVDGGTSAGGYDYIFGELDAIATEGGEWVVSPTVIGNTLQARWRTRPITLTGNGGGGGGGAGGGGGGGGGGSTFIYDPEIEVQFIGTLLHDTLRVQFQILNKGAGKGHTVGLAFVEDIDAVPGPGNIDGPLRLKDTPLLVNETSLSGGQIPEFFETIFKISPTSYHTIRGKVRPAASLENEPTPPTRLVYARNDRINVLNLGGTLGRNYNRIWNFIPDPTIPLGSGTGVGVQDAAVGLFWSESALAPGQTRSIITYIGQANANVDQTGILGLAVIARDALGTINGVSDPANFDIKANVRNMTDLPGFGALNTGKITLSLDLPKGLRRVTGFDRIQELDGLASGQESGVFWTVEPDPANAVGGTLTYSVTATPAIGGVGKTVQRTIQLASPSVVKLISNVTNQGRYQMISIPFQTSGDLPSKVLGLNQTDFELLRYDPLRAVPGASPTDFYPPQNSFQAGYGYWIRSYLATDYIKTITGYQALPNQTPPNPTPYRISLPRGWNQIGNPFLYAIPFSEIQVFDTETFEVLTLDQAADPLRQWVLPAIYRYETGQRDENWGYRLIDNLGTLMQPYEGYWLNVRKSTLQIIFPGVSTPYASSRSVLTRGLGPQLGQKTRNNWRLRISAQSENGADLDNYVGVAPKATDELDGYKYEKPPVVTQQTSLDIVTKFRNGSGRYAQDLRAPGMGRKTWDIVVRSPKPKQNVTLTWPDIVASVPRDYQLVLIDKDTKTQRIMRSTASYVVNTGQDAMRQLQIVAEPARASNRVQIATMDITSGAGGRAAAQSVSINYSLTQAADTRIFIRDGRGRAVRTLVGRTRAAEGDSTTGNVVWDLRDERGTSISAGVYNVEIVAQSTDGQKVRRTLPYLITR